MYIPTINSLANSHFSVVVKELSQKMILLIYWSTYVPTLTQASVSREARWCGLGIWLGCLPDASLMRCSGHIPTRRGPREDQGHAGGTVSLGWELGKVAGGGKSGPICLGSCPCHSTLVKCFKMDWWMDGCYYVILLRQVFRTWCGPKGNSNRQQYQYLVSKINVSAFGRFFHQSIQSNAVWLNAK